MHTTTQKSVATPEASKPDNRRAGQMKNVTLFI